eukprot:CAMPEP_0195286138 /NCGR_PEP_ID=MMETSP0707-20130614/3710_1 /TAXON_ID=33640 /ORGANISM="Asterionellopsis glacialis, Strain CCMP134" /LENGTH=338 /DNA_ID=CAMNT_0040345735 /DNA_START=197 /DNA_END=1213 /DNA_ORIENTATION=+
MTTTTTRVQCLSSEATAPIKTISIPSNLRIDPRSTVSPVFGCEPIVEDDEEEDFEDGEDPLERDYDGDDYDDDEEDGDYNVKEILYDATNAPTPDYVIPLPDRLHVPVMDWRDGTEVGSIHIKEGIFGYDDIRTDLIHRVVVYQRNKKRGFRNPAARTKTIGEVRGSGRKVRPQKGQGTARAGHRRPPHWRGGAKAHGPKGKETNYNTKLNKKVRVLGLKHTLSQKLKEGNLIIVNDLNVESHKTQDLQRHLDNFGISGREGTTAFLLDHYANDNNEDDVEEEVATLDRVPVELKVASRNLYKIKVSNQVRANVYDMLKYEKLVMSLSALQALESRLW